MPPKVPGRHVVDQIAREDAGLSWKSAATLDRQRHRNKRTRRQAAAAKTKAKAAPKVPPTPPVGPRTGQRTPSSEEARSEQEDEDAGDEAGSSPLGLRVPSSSAKGPDVQEVHRVGLFSHHASASKEGH